MKLVPIAPSAFEPVKLQWTPKLHALAESIRLFGVQNPVTAVRVSHIWGNTRREMYKVVDGRLRVFVCQNTGSLYIPTQVVDWNKPEINQYRCANASNDSELRGMSETAFKAWLLENEVNIIK